MNWKSNSALVAWFSVVKEVCVRIFANHSARGSGFRYLRRDTSIRDFNLVKFEHTHIVSGSFGEYSFDWGRAFVQDLGVAHCNMCTHFSFQFFMSGCPMVIAPAALAARFLLVARCLRFPRASIESVGLLNIQSMRLAHKEIDPVDWWTDHDSSCDIFCSYSKYCKWRASRSSLLIYTCPWEWNSHPI